MIDEDTLRAVERALASPIGLAPLAAEWAPAIVMGLPWYAAITIRSQNPDIAMRGLLSAGPHGDGGAFGLRIQRNQRAEVLVDEQPSPHLDDHCGHPSFDLDFGEARRLLVDLSPLVPWRLVAPDTYSVVVRYRGGLDESLVGESEPTIARFVASTPELTALASTRRPAVEESGSWLAACEQWTDEGNTPDLDAAHPLALPLLLARRSRDPDGFAKLHPARFQGWDRSVEPNVRLLYVEWLLARREADQARQEAIWLRERTPGLAAEIEALGLDLPPMSETP